MKKLVLAAVVLAILTFGTAAAGAKALDFDAEAYILIDSKSGQVLAERNSEAEHIYPASTTKIMTAILALERGNLDQVMTASEAAVNDIGKDGMNIGIMPGEQIPMRWLLHGLLVASANETANIIAENISATRQEFVDLMNEKARELGALHTHFVNPCGSHDDNHYTTASDLAKIARYAMSLPEFRKIAEKTQFTMPATNKHNSWPELFTTNKLMRRKQSDLFTVNGIKTGYTGPAGYNLVASGINKDGMELISVIMGEKSADSGRLIYDNSSELLEYGFTNFGLKKLVEANQPVADLRVDGANEGVTLKAAAENEISAVLPNDSALWNLSKTEYVRSGIEAPVAKGTIVGYIEYARNGISLGKTDLVAAEAIEKAPESKAPAAVKIGQTVKNTAGNPLFLRVAYTAAGVLAFFTVLRFVLRRISRRRKVRRYRY